MTLNKKILFLTISALCGLIIVFYLISSTILKKNFSDLDENTSRYNVQRAINALDNEIASLNITVGDYASWDDTYKFIQDKNQDYINLNMMEETFVNLRVNLMIFINKSGEIIYSKYFDLEDKSELPVFESIYQYLSANKSLLDHEDLKSNKKGIILLPEGPILVVSRPIITSDHKGPIKGTLIMGRMLTKKWIEEFCKLTQLLVSIEPIEKTTINEEIFNEVVDDNTIVGKTILKDISNNPILMMSVTTKREGYAHWKISNKYFIFSLIIVGVIFIFIMLIFIKRLILNRLLLLSESTKTIAEKQDFSIRIPYIGEDELSKLTMDINFMIDSLEKSQRKLKESEEWLSTTLMSIGEAVIATDENGKVIFQNKIAETLTGWTSKEAFQKPLNEIFNIVNEFTKEKLENPADKIIKEGVVKELANHIVLISKDGREIPIANSGAPIKDENGNIKGVVLVFSDVTEHIKVINELEFRLAFENIIIDISNRFMNLPFNEINREIDEALKKIGEFFNVDRCYLFTISDDNTTMSNVNEWCRDGIEPYKDKLQNIPINKFSWIINKLKEGGLFKFSSLNELPKEAEAEREEFILEQIKSLINVPIIYQGNLKAFIGLDAVRSEMEWSEDIASLLKVVGEIFLNALQRVSSEAERLLLVTAIEQSAETIIITDIDGKVQYANPAFEKITGYSIKEVLGKKTSLLKSGNHNEEFYENLWSTIKSGNIWSGHFINKRKDGLLYEEDAVISPVRDTSGNIVNFVAVKKDVTKEVKIANQLREAHKMEAIGTLAGGIAHDFNNILTAILGYANIIKLKSSPNDKIFQAAEVIEKAANQGAQLTAQLLGFARRGKHQIIPVNLHNVIQDVMKILNRTIPKNIEIIQKLYAEPPYIKGDPSQLEQIIMNLAVNANDAMSNGGKLIFETDIVELDEEYCKIHNLSNAGKYLLIYVTDTGVGIPKEIQDRIFEPFFTTKELGKGTGMGLATVYGIVKNHQGSISVYSEVGVGTTFKIYFPLYTGKNIPLKPVKSEQVITGSATILLVDDESLVIDVSAETLRHLGYKVITALDGEQAIDYYKKNYKEIDLVILDMIMPKKGGKDCFREMKMINPNIIAILASGYSMDGEAQKLIDEGIRGFIQKPFQISHVGEVISNALNKKA